MHVYNALQHSAPGRRKEKLCGATLREIKLFLFEYFLSFHLSRSDSKIIDEASFLN